MTPQEAIQELKDASDSEVRYGDTEYHYNDVMKRVEAFDMAIKALEQTRWIPVSERLPEDLEPVNITWVNHNPESYYADIKDKPFTGTGHYCNGRWWWYSVICQDYLNEYGQCDVDAMNDDIDVIAWMPLPQPYKAESEDVK